MHVEFYKKYSKSYGVKINQLFIIKFHLSFIIYVDN